MCQTAKEDINCIINTIKVFLKLPIVTVSLKQNSHQQPFVFPVICHLEPKRGSERSGVVGRLFFNAVHPLSESQFPEGVLVHGRCLGCAADKVAASVTHPGRQEEGFTATYSALGVVRKASVS